MKNGSTVIAYYRGYFGNISEDSNSIGIVTYLTYREQNNKDEHDKELSSDEIVSITSVN
jgi:hypothetical protein